ncbi:cytochrome P450 [Nocardia sp. NEAU-G5]|uniref:Cytochrome P450 n=1 Tax=Nocardia albiluteola TaxID=2842303 RepID=A0ABS6B3A4_9NOCA|nr:cytochrome P450 [Nocardia albiluteola]MBU3064776.1 cytochrome P450 [Nocardia albiluteola]
MSVESEVRHYPFGDLAGPEIHPLYERLRREEPLTRIRLPYGGDGWMVTRYEDAKFVLSDPRFSRSVTVGREDIPRLIPEPPEPEGLLSMDPPEHSRLRKLVSKAFTGPRVEQLRPRAQQIVDARLDAIEQMGAPADLVEEFALPVPVTIICEMLGVPAADQHRFRDFSDALLSTTAYTREEIVAAQDELVGYLAEVVAERRRAVAQGEVPEDCDDLLGALVAARDNDDRLSEAELVQLGMTVLIAGHETTAKQISNFTYLLLTRPDRWRQLLADPELVPAAVEEMLRYVQLGNGVVFPRVATEDLEIAGATVRAGEAVFVHLLSANRDETIFHNAAELDLARPSNQHVTFGYGVHHCLGAQLARVELQVAIGSLLRRFPNLTLAIPADEVRWQTGLVVSGPTSLPVRW